MQQDDGWKMCPFGIRSSKDTLSIYCEKFVHPRRSNNFTCKLPLGSVVKLTSFEFYDVDSANLYATLKHDVTFIMDDIIFYKLWGEIISGTHGLSIMQCRTCTFLGKYVNVNHFDPDGKRHGPRTTFCRKLLKENNKYQSLFQNQNIKEQTWYWRDELVSKTTYDAILESIHSQLSQTVSHIEGLTRIVLEYATMPDQTGHTILDNFEWHSNSKHIQPVSCPNFSLSDCF